MSRSFLSTAFVIALVGITSLGARCMGLPYVPVYRGTTLLDNIGVYAVRYRYFDGRSGAMPLGWTGVFTEDTGIACAPFGTQNGKSAFFLGPIWRGGGSGDTSQVFYLAMPQAPHITLSFNVAMRTDFVGPKFSDGSIFRVYANHRLIMEYYQTTADWKRYSLDLTRYAGQKLELEFQTDPGPKRDPSFDYALWGNRRIICDGGTSAGNGIHWPTVANAFTSHATYGAASPLSYGRGGPVLRAAWKPRLTGFLKGITLTVGSSAAIPAISPTFGASVDLVRQDGSIISSADPSVHVSTQVIRPAKGTHALAVRKYLFVLQGKSYALTATAFKPKGNAMKVVVTSASRHIAAVHFGEFGVKLDGDYFPPDYRTNVAVPYYGTVYYLPQYRLFTNVCIDYSLSHASDLGSDSATYGQLTNGTRHRVNETVYYAISPQLADVLPTPPNPASTYRALMSNLTILDIWGNTFDQDRQLLNALGGYGVTNLFTIIHNWQHGGYDNELPDVMPPASSLGGLSAMQALVKTAKGLGERIGVHENYVDYYPNAPSYNPAYVALGSDGKPVLAWKNLIQSYALSMQHTMPIAEHYDSEIASQLGTNGTFEDVCSAVPPWFHVDFNANTKGAGEFHTVMHTFTRLWAMYRAHHNGPVLGEGNNHWYWSGLLDGSEAQFGSGWPQNEGEIAPLSVNFDLLKIHPLQLNHGMGYLERWQSEGYSDGWQTRTMTSKVMDCYRAQEIAYGHSSFVPSQLVNNIPYVWQESNLVPPVIKRLAMSPVESILYRYHHTWLTVEQMTAVNAFCDRIQVKYKSGLTIQVNRSSRAWRLGTGTKAVILPSSGWRAFGDGISASTATHSGITSDFVHTAHRLFVDARSHYHLGPKQYQVRPSVFLWRPTGPRQFQIQYKWQVGEKLPAGTQVFVHLIAASTNHAAKTDPTGIVEVMDDGLNSLPYQWPIGTTLSKPITVTLPQNVPAGNYHIRLGIWFPLGGRRLLLQGSSDDGRRVLVGNLTIAGDNGDLSFNRSGTNASLGVDSVEDTNPLAKVVDFGPVRTNGSFLAVQVTRTLWKIHAYPHGDAFKVKVLGSLFGVAHGAVHLIAVGSDGSKIGTVPVQRNGKWLLFRLNNTSDEQAYLLTTSVLSSKFARK